MTSAGNENGTDQSSRKCFGVSIPKAFYDAHPTEQLFLPAVVIISTFMILSYLILSNVNRRVSIAIWVMGNACSLP